MAANEIAKPVADAIASFFKSVNIEPPKLLVTVAVYREIIEIEHKYLQVLESLSPKCRKVFEMSRMEGRKNQEIADEIDVVPRTVERKLGRIRNFWDRIEKVDT